MVHPHHGNGWYILIMAERPFVLDLTSPLASAWARSVYRESRRSEAPLSDSDQQAVLVQARLTPDGFGIPGYG